MTKKWKPAPEQARAIQAFLLAGLEQGLDAVAMDFEFSDFTPQSYQMHSPDVPEVQMEVRTRHGEGQIYMDICFLAGKPENPESPAMLSYCARQALEAVNEHFPRLFIWPQARNGKDRVAGSCYIASLLQPHAIQVILPENWHQAERLREGVDAELCAAPPIDVRVQAFEPAAPKRLGQGAPG